MENEKRWYVIHVYSGYEKKIKSTLERRIVTTGMEDRIFNVLVPEEDVLEQDKKTKKRKMVTKKVYPGYILVEMIMTDDSWYIVRNTQGVTGFVGTGSRPYPLEPQEVEQIHKMMQPNPNIGNFQGNIGDRVEVLEGAFAGFEATIVDIDNEKSRLHVKLPMLGRDTDVELGFDQVSPI